MQDLISARRSLVSPFIQRRHKNVIVSPSSGKQHRRHDARLITKKIVAKSIDSTIMIRAPTHPWKKNRDPPAGTSSTKSRVLLYAVVANNEGLTQPPKFHSLSNNLSLRGLRHPSAGARPQQTGGERFRIEVVQLLRTRARA